MSDKRIIVYFIERKEAIPGLGYRRVRDHWNASKECKEYRAYRAAQEAARKDGVSGIKAKAEEVKNRFGFYPCMDAGTDMSAYCPKAGLGGCIGQWSECNAGYVGESAVYRNLYNSLPLGSRRGLPAFSMPQKFLELVKGKAKKSLDERKKRRSK